ncbi:VrrA protein [Ectobacillus sp. JY-23]|uniref:VrrA/YqfQ family protein n=1 Tax=Ectobacillus sp. JY-23 TaxID=2933872 RepID=UPI001FF12829|nr:VrrA/YqfQ family protein [Ectobacillus sp. JY-23]UOY94033.1 VrrA protein [Ectobacillus sp. JY-23]
MIRTPYPQNMQPRHMSPLPPQQMQRHPMQGAPHPMRMPYTNSPGPSMSPHPSYYQGMQPHMQQKPPGFLARLFGKKTPMPGPNQQAFQVQANQQQAPVRMMPEAASAAAGAATQNTASIGSFFSNMLSNPSAMLGNVEKVVKVAQTVSPMVQQYGPIVKSFPSIVKILTSKSTEESEENTEVTPPSADSVKPVQKKKKTTAPEPEATPKATPEPPVSSQMKPKLYV